MITVKKIEKWETSDGVVHSSQEMAHQYIMNAEMCADLGEAIYLRQDVDAQDIVNWIASNAKRVRAFLDACEAMEKAGLR